MEYLVLVKLNGEWQEVARVEAADHTDALAKGELALPPQYKGRAMGLKSLAGPPAEGALQPQSPRTDAKAL